MSEPKNADRFEIGPISFSRFLTHYGETFDHRLCVRDTPIEIGTANTWTTDAAKVTCESCLDWMHA